MLQVLANAALMGCATAFLVNFLMMWDGMRLSIGEPNRLILVIEIAMMSGLAGLGLFNLVHREK